MSEDFVTFWALPTSSSSIFSLDADFTSRNETFVDFRVTVQLDEFDQDTPIFKNLHFTNIIAMLNPNAERFLVLAAHYDSKYFPNEEFLGATDSAVPCAMLLNLAHVMSKYFDQIKSKADVSIKIVMFDGEEAFKTWTATDSVSLTLISYRKVFKIDISHRYMVHDTWQQSGKKKDFFTAST